MKDKLYKALKTGSLVTVIKFQKQEILQYKPKDPYFGCSALHIAAANNQVVIVKYLIENFPELLEMRTQKEISTIVLPANQSVTLDKGSDALLVAVASGAVEVIQFFTDRKLFTHSMNNSGDTSLKIALLLDNPQIYTNTDYVKAQMMLADEHGVNAFHCCCLQPNVVAMHQFFLLARQDELVLSLLQEAAMSEIDGKPHSTYILINDKPRSFVNLVCAIIKGNVQYNPGTFTTAMNNLSSYSIKISHSDFTSNSQPEVKAINKARVSIFESEDEDFALKLTNDV